MSETPERQLAAVSQMVAEMDQAVNDVHDWSKAFVSLSMSDHDIDTGALRVMANAFATNADDLKRQWEQTFASSRTTGREPSS